MPVRKTYDVVQEEGREVRNSEGRTGPQKRVHWLRQREAFPREDTLPGDSGIVWKHCWLSQGGEGVQLEARDAAEHPTKHRAGPHNVESSRTNVNNAEAGIPG